jgi:large subunit ribosomal protein L10
MPTSQKQETISEIKDRFSASESVILADYRGLTVKEMQQLRVKLRESGAEVKVYKNTLTQIALRELEMPSLDEYLEGPTAFVFAAGDPVGPAKAITAFMKDHAALELKGGFVQRAVIDAAGVKAIATLPSRDELLAKIMGSLVNPVRGFMAMCNAPAGALARTMQAVADQKAAA